MNAQTSEVATTEQQPTRDVVAISDTAAAFRLLGFPADSLDQALHVCELIAKSSLVPKSYRNKDGHVEPGDVLIAIQIGFEVGLQPMQALQSIAVINGMPCIWGNGRRALVKAHPDFEWQDEDWDEQTQTAVCTMKRRNQPAQTKTFSWKDAVQARLDKKETYIGYPRDMCGQRAHARCTDAVFPDAMKGLRHAEAVIDLEPTDYSDVTVERRVPREPHAIGAKISNDQHGMIRKAIRAAAGGDAEKEKKLADGYKAKFGIEHSNDLLAKDYDLALTWINDQTPAKTA